MTWTREKALKDVTVLTISQYTVQVLTVLRGFLFGKYLGPEGFGVWASIYLFYTYGQYCNSGVFQAAAILVPQRIGAGKIEEANRYLSSAITWTNMFSSFFFIAVIFYVIFNSSEFVSLYWLPIIIVSFAVPVYQNFFFSINRLQFKHNFKKAGIFQALLSLMDVSLSFFLLMNYGILGAFLGMLISFIIVTILVTKDGYKDLYMLFSKDTFFELFKVGFQVLLIAFTFTFVTTVDKFSVASFFSKLDMGLFSMASSVAMVPYTISIAMNGVIFQRMLEEYGKTKSLGSIKIFLDEGILAIAFLMPILSVLLITLAEPLVTLLLPKYIDSLKYVDKLSVGVYFLGISIICWSFLLVQKKYLIIIFLQVTLIIIIVFCDYIVSKIGSGLQGVSLLTIANYLIYSTILYYFSYKNYYEVKKIFQSFLRLSLPVLVIFSVFLLKLVVFNAVYILYLRFVIAIIWSIFAYSYLKKHTIIMNQILDSIKEKFRSSYKLSV